MKLFLDTNMLIDYYSAREPYAQFFFKLQAMRAFGDAELWASAKSFTDVFYVCKKVVSGDALQRAFANSGEFLNICSISRSDIFEAAGRRWPDFEDCLIAIAAEKVKADYLVTRDPKGFAQSKVPIIAPGELFGELETKHGLVYASFDC